MRVLIDSNALIYLLDPRTPKKLANRMQGLLQEIDRTRGSLIIPVQAIGEYLSGVGPAGQTILSALQRNRNVEIASFDYKAAAECAFMEATAINSGDKRAPLGRDVKWQKVKVDRQIVAMAKVRSVDFIVSSDGDIPKLAKALGIRCVQVEDLDLPDWAIQMHIDEVPDVEVMEVPVQLAPRMRRLYPTRKSPSVLPSETDAS